jgi:hypothetical protein
MQLGEVDAVDHALDTLNVSLAQRRNLPDVLCQSSLPRLTGLDGGRVEPGPIHSRQRVGDDADLFGADLPGSLRGGQQRPDRLQRLTAPP